MEVAPDGEVVGPRSSADPSGRGRTISQRPMRRSAITGLMVIGFAAAFAAPLDAFGQVSTGGPEVWQPMQFRYLRPGLWELRLMGAWVDGRSVTRAQMEMLVDTPAGRRIGMEAVVKPASIGDDGAAQMCFTPSMLSGDMPRHHLDTVCKARGGRYDDNHVYYEVTCGSKGGANTRTQVWADEPGAGGHVKVTVKDTAHEANGATHVIRVRTKLDYVRRDCGDLKPVAPAK